MASEIKPAYMGKHQHFLNTKIDSSQPSARDNKWTD